MAGHPTIGSTFALARAGVHRAGARALRVRPGRRADAGGADVARRDLTLRVDDAAAADVRRADRRSAPARPRALGLPEAAVAGTGLPVQVVSCGVPFLFVPLATRRAVDNAALDRAAYRRRCFRRAPVEASTASSCFRPERGGDKRHGVQPDVRAGRSASPKIRRPAARAVRSAATSSGTRSCRRRKAGAMLSLQGVKMGRPSHIHMSIGVEGGEITSVRVGGEAVLAGEGTLYIPVRRSVMRRVVSVDADRRGRSVAGGADCAVARRAGAGARRAAQAAATPPADRASC